jgi:hypothetical protein
MLRRGQRRRKVAVRGRSVHRHPLFCEILERRLLLSTVNWTGAGDGVNWTDPNNWSTHSTPGTSDDVIISAAGNPTIQLALGTQSVNSVTSSDPINVAGATLQVATRFQFSANVFLGAAGTIKGGTITGTGGAELVPGSNSDNPGTLDGVTIDTGTVVDRAAADGTAVTPADRGAAARAAGKPVVRAAAA